MSEPGRPPRRGRDSRGRPSPASLGVVRVDADFEDEYPGADRTCTEAYASLCRTGEALLGELDRRVRLTFGIPQAAATALAVIDGAGVPLTPSQVSDRVLIASATMTATLDLLERRGWIRRVANPSDRRSTLIEITPDGRAATDQLLPGIRTLEKSVLSALTAGERAHLLDLLTKILAHAAEVAARQPEPLSGRRIRPARLSGLPHSSHPTLNSLYRVELGCGRFPSRSGPETAWSGLRIAGQTGRFCCAPRRVLVGCGWRTGEPAFVGDDDELCPVARVELGQESADVGLCRGAAHVQPLGDLGVRQPSGNLAQHLKFAVRERFQDSGRDECGPDAGGEGFDQAPGDGRGQQRLARSYDPDPIEELLR